jgi:hypothetical protein
LSFRRRSGFAIGGKADVADRVHDQRSLGTDRQEMNEAGAAENHSCHNIGKGADVNPVHLTLAGRGGLLIRHI